MQNAPFLVDFERKKEDPNAQPFIEAPEDDDRPDDDADYSEVEDEFGRIKRVKRRYGDLPLHDYCAGKRATNSFPGLVLGASNTKNTWPEKGNAIQPSCDLKASVTKMHNASKAVIPMRGVLVETEMTPENG